MENTESWVLSTIPHKRSGIKYTLTIQLEEMISYDSKLPYYKHYNTERSLG